MAGMRLSVGVGLDLANLWRQLGQAQAGLNAAAAKQTNFAVGVAGGPAPAAGNGGGSSLLKDVATAALAAKAAAGTIASPFLSLRVELRALGLEMAGNLAQGANEMERAGGFLRDVAKESAVQAGRARQEDMERFSQERKAIAAAKAAKAAKIAPAVGSITKGEDGSEVLHLRDPGMFRGAQAAILRVQAAIARLRAAGADLEVGMIRNSREIGVAFERLGKIFGAITLPLRASVGVVRNVIGWFSSYEDRVGRVAKRMGLLEGATKAAASVAAAPFRAANAATNAIGRMGTGAALLGGGMAAGLGVAIKAGSDLNETLSKVDTVFGDASGRVKADADELANKFGVPKNTFLDSAASIGLIGKAAGQTEAQAAAFGSQFSQLALDMMSFYNVPLDEALKSVRSGLVGETEPMRRFGVLLSADRVEAEAFRLGLVETGEELTEQQKVQARSSLIMKGLSDAQGDLARTANAPANLMRTLGGRLGNVASTIGQAVLPGVQSFLQLLNEMAIDAENGSGLIVSAFEWVGGAIKSVVDTIGVIYRNWGAYQEILSATVEARLRNVGEVLSWLRQVFSAVLDWVVQNWTTILPDAFEAVKTAFVNLAENVRQIWTEVWNWIRSAGADPIELNLTPLLKGAQFQSGEFKMPSLELSAPDADRIAAANQKIADAETARVNAMKAQQESMKRGVLNEGPEEEGKKKKSDLGRTLDLSAFREQLQQGLFDKDKQRGLKAQEKAADGIGKLNEKVGELNENVKKINVGMA